MVSRNLERLPAFDGDALNVIVETSRGQRSKYKYDSKLDIFRFHKLLPVGQFFPFNFGFLPSTIGGDGDPLDVLLLGDEPIPMGTLVLGDVLAVLEADQTQDGKTNRNDRVIAVPLNAKSRKPVQPELRLDETLTTNIEKFFVAYNQLQGREFKSRGTHGKGQAMEIIKQAVSNAARKTKGQAPITA
jgi:inorganic pyrophosphatase